MAKVFFRVVYRFFRQVKAASSGSTLFLGNRQSCARISDFKTRIDSSIDKITVVLHCLYKQLMQHAIRKEMIYDHQAAVENTSISRLLQAQALVQGE